MACESRNTDLTNELQLVLELVQALRRRDGEDEDEPVSSRDGHLLHFRELVGPSCVSYMQCADCIAGRHGLQQDRDLGSTVNDYF